MLVLLRREGLNRARGPQLRAGVWPALSMPVSLSPFGRLLRSRTVPSNERGQQYAVERPVEKGFDTNDHIALTQSSPAIPLAYEFYTLSRRPHRAGTAKAVSVAEARPASAIREAVPLLASPR